MGWSVEWTRGLKSEIHLEQLLTLITDTIGEIQYE